MALGQFIDRVTLQLSDRCPHAGTHVECPAHFYRSEVPAVMPYALVHRVITGLGEQDFSGAISLHGMSEPLADHRTAKILDLINARCPGATALIFTSGWLLTAATLADLRQACRIRLVVTAYSDDEYARIPPILAASGIDWRLKRGSFERILDSYDRPARPRPGLCSAPFSDLVIRPNGEIGLCCRDWANKHPLGIITDNLAGALADAQDRMLLTYKSLWAGESPFALCESCGHARWWNNWRRPDPPRPEEILPGAT